MKRKYKVVEDGIVIALAITATLAAVYVNTNWFVKNKQTTERERCYGVAQAGKNDCATAKHSCANQSIVDNDPNEWIMVPTGLCKRLTGGIKRD